VGDARIVRTASFGKRPRGGDMKCFVAMAFGREDTDAVFDRSILPVLTEMGIDVVRVDRVEHNDNIDDRILSEIDDSDFALADLTYARPSVYYEAGYAERQIPVIYTIRSDHLKPKAEDEFGNLRLHFDLAMKNVIDWPSPDDEIFAEKLRSRAAYVSRPIAAAKDHDRTLIAAERAFSGLPLADRRALLVKIVAELLEGGGYENPLAAKSSWGVPAHFKPGAGKISTVQASFNEEAGQIWAASFKPRWNLNTAGNLPELEKADHHVVILDLEDRSIADLEQHYPDFETNREESYLEKNDSIDIPALKAGFKGAVLIEHVRIRNSLGDKISRFIQSDAPPYKWGFRTDEYPRGLTFQEFMGDYFAYEGFGYKKLQRKIRVYLISNIKSEPQFRSSFAQLIERAL
jgi:nucleoside 2-deoxyribosyltransferase